MRTTIARLAPRLPGFVLSLLSLASIAALAATVTLASFAARAGAITYSFDGLASGSLNGVTFTDARFTVQALGDASQVIPLDANVYCSPLSLVYFSIPGVGSGRLTDGMAAFDNTAPGVSALGLQRGCNTADWFGMRAPEFGSYHLDTAYGPVTAATYTQDTVNTTVGPLLLSSTGPLVFNAAFGSFGPAAQLSPSSLAFAARLVASTSAPLTATLTNNGSAPLAIASIIATGDFAIAGTTTCSTALAAEASCVIDVTFTPTAPGTRSGTLSVSSDSPGSPHTVSLTGNGVIAEPVPAPNASLTPGSLSFAARTVSTTSPAQTVTLTNTGNATLAISSIETSGDFAFATACPASLAAGATCTVDVTFMPLLEGTRAGTLSISTNAAGSPHSVSLSGTGTSALVPAVLLSESAIDFEPTIVGRDSAPELLTVSNAGSATLTFGTIAVTGDYRSVTLPASAAGPECPMDLAPGASCQIALVFHPTNANLRTGVLSITTNAATAPATVSLAGFAAVPLSPQLSLPATLSFGGVPVGTTGDGRSLAIRNTSLAPATLTELTASGDFSVSDTCTTIAAGATCSPLVTFTPTALGPRTGTLTIRTLRDVDPYVVGLTGTGEENRLPVMQVSPTAIGFGNTFIGQSLTLEVTLRNAGLAPLVVSSISAGGSFLADSSCVTTLAPGAACTVRVSFPAGVPGPQSSFLEIASNAPGSPHHVGLSGTVCHFPSPTRARLGGLLCGP